MRKEVFYSITSSCSAAGETRTPNPFRELAPEASVSTSFTTAAASPLYQIPAFLRIADDKGIVAEGFAGNAGQSKRVVNLACSPTAYGAFRFAADEDWCVERIHFMDATRVDETP